MYLIHLAQFIKRLLIYLFHLLALATAEEIQVLSAFHKQDADSLTVRDFVRGVAKLGGFLGRKHDGEPGVLTLWRGYQRLQDMLQGYQLQTSSTPKDRRVIGNR